MALSAPSMPKRFWPRYLVARNRLEGLGRVEPAQDVALLTRLDHHAGPFDLALDPGLLHRLLDVHVLDADRAAVRVAQQVQQGAQSHAVLTADAVGQELAVEVPDGQAVGLRRQLGMHVRLFGGQRIEIGDEVASHPMGVDQLVDPHLLLEHGGGVVDRIDVAAPFDRLVGNPDRSEHLDVEVVGPDEQLVHPLEEQPRLGSLDDAVVVGRRDGDDLGQAQGGQRGRIGAFVLGGEPEGAHAHDGALPGHEARHRLEGADGARVGQAHGHTGEVVRTQLVGAHLADQVLVGGPEAAEVEGVGVADAGHQQGATVRALDVDSQAQADVVVVHHPRLAVVAGRERVVHGRHGLGDRSHHGVADQVGEAHLPAPGAAQIAVDDRAVDLEQLGRDLAEAGGGGHLEAGGHVGGDEGGRAPQRLAHRVVRAPGRGDLGSRSRSRSRSRCRRSSRAGRVRESRRGRIDRSRIGSVVGEELVPALAHRRRIRQVLLVHLVDQPGVRTDLVGGRVRVHDRMVPARSGAPERLARGCRGRR